NLDYLRKVVGTTEFQAGGFPTNFLSRITYEPRAIEVVEPGMQTTVQDYPGRLGYWNIGVPPSGPMDSLAFRFANHLVGNPESAAALECTMTGPTLRFYSDAVIAITGAAMAPHLDGISIPSWQAIEVRAGSFLHLNASEVGSRSYIAVRGGID